MNNERTLDELFHRKEWGWNHNIGLSELVEIMITNLKKVQNTIREAIKKEYQ